MIPQVLLSVCQSVSTVPTLPPSARELPAGLLSLSFACYPAQCRPISRLSLSLSDPPGDPIILVFIADGFPFAEKENVPFRSDPRSSRMTTIILRDPQGKPLEAGRTVV